MKSFCEYMVLFLTLAGCSNTTGRPAPYTVDIPIKVACIQKVIEPPGSYLDYLDAGASDIEKLEALLADFELDKTYIASLQSQLNECTSN